MRPLLLIILFISPMSSALAESRRVHRNPFRAPPEAPPTPYHRDPASLEGYPLAELRLTAIIRDGDGALFASVETPSGIGFKVTEGTIVGESHGEVINVGVDRITVREELPSSDGKPTVQEILLHPKTDSTE